MKSAPLTILQFHNEYPTNDACLDKLFRDRFYKPECPQCGKVDQYSKVKGRARYTCSCGKHHIFPKAGTIFEKSSTDLVKWFFAIYLFSQSRNGVAAKELERELGVTYKTAWRMGTAIRKLMSDAPVWQTGEVEADETWIGGRRRQQEKYSNKTIVFGSVERKGKVNAQIVSDTTEETLRKPICENVAKGSKLLTDEWRAYKSIAHIYGYTHDTVKHSVKEYVRGDVHTNTIEGFWSQLKRSIDGTYHVVSPKYLASYLSEFQWRYNHRKSNVHMFDLLLGRVALPHVAAANRISAFQ